MNSLIRVAIFHVFRMTQHLPPCIVYSFSSCSDTWLVCLHYHNWPQLGGHAWWVHRKWSHHTSGIHIESQIYQQNDVPFSKVYFCSIMTNRIQIALSSVYTMTWEKMFHIDGLVQERCNSSALAMELHLSCINPSICTCSMLLYWLGSYWILSQTDRENNWPWAYPFLFTTWLAHEI